VSVLANKQKRCINVILVDAFLDLAMMLILLVPTIIFYFCIIKLLFSKVVSELSVGSIIILAALTALPIILFLIIFKLYEKNMLITKEDFIVENGEGKVVIKWLGKFQFSINKYLKDIEKYDFEYDMNEKSTSYIDRTRIFLSLKRYKDEKFDRYNEKTKAYFEDAMRKNINELTENSKGVRKATEAEIVEIEKRFLINKIMAFSLYIIVIPTLHMPKTFIIGIILLVSVAVIIINLFAKIFKVKNALYLIAECKIMEKFNYNTGAEVKSSHFKVRCQDAQKLYIDNWFECDYETYKNGKIKIVIVKNKNGKVYINSFDKLWRVPSYVIKVQS